jgi:hypothetical protein
MRNAYKILVENPERKRQLGRPRRRWEYKIKIDVKEIVCDGVDLIHLPFTSIGRKII